MATLRFAIRLFLVLMAYYLMKPVREALILDDGSAELRSYALSAQAGLLLILVPFYTKLIKHFLCENLFRVVTLFMVSNILIFYLFSLYGVDVGIIFFIWLGIFSVIEITQFWAMVSDFHCVESGKRLMTYIAIGGSLGAMIGSIIAKVLFVLLGTYNLMLLSAFLLLLTLWPKLSSLRAPTIQATLIEDHDPKETWHHLLGGFRHMIHLPYLRWIALFIILLNLINSTGEYVLAHFVVEAFADSPDRSADIGNFYSSFYVYVNVLTLFLQLFMVRPMYRMIGVTGALMTLTIVNLSMYVSVLFLPVLAWFTFVKVVENGVDYSLANTTKQILFLPLDRSIRSEALTVIMTFFKRFGDVIQGGVVFVCVAWLGLSFSSLIAINITFCLMWILVALRINKHFNLLNASSGGHQEETDKLP